MALNVGSDDTVRATADLSRPVALLGDTGAFRLNVLAHRGEVAERNGARMERFGIAPSLGIGIGTDTQAHVRLHETDVGRPAGLRLAVARQRVRHPSSAIAFYGFDSDYLETDADILSAQVLHRVSDTIRLDIQARYADYEREKRITEPLITPVPPAGTPPEQISVYRYVFAGSSDETFFTTQAVARFDLGADRVRHALVTGVELGRETSAPLFAFGIGVPGTNLLESRFVAAVHAPRRSTRGSSRIPKRETAGVVCARHLEAQRRVARDARRALGSLRHGRMSRTDSPARRRRSTPASASGRESYAQVDEEASYRAALVYKPAERRACISRPARRSIRRRRACRS